MVSDVMPKIITHAHDEENETTYAHVTCHNAKGDCLVPQLFPGLGQWVKR